MPAPKRPTFPSRRPVVLGVVHLPPLPGSPAWLKARREGAAGLHRWSQRAVSDALAYVECGFDGVVVENFGDAPFYGRRVPPETVAALALAAGRVREALPPSAAVGVNVLRCDAPAAVAIASAARLDFIRANVLAGAVVTDQGVIEGEAAEVGRDRERLAPDVAVLADVRVKHAAPLASRPLEEEAQDLLERGGADALILTGARTGAGVDEEELRALRRALPDARLLLGSGATRHTVRGLLALADGVIVGTAVKRGRRTQGPVDRRRAAAFADAARD